MAGEARRDQAERQDEGQEGGLGETDRAKPGRLDKGVVEPGGRGGELGAGKRGDPEHLEEENHQFHPAPRCQEAAFREPGQGGEIERQQEGDGAGHARAPIEEPAVGQGQDQERQDQAAPVEAPGEQDADAEDPVERDGEERREGIPKGGEGRHDGGGQEQDAARQEVPEGPFQDIFYAIIARPGLT